MDGFSAASDTIYSGSTVPLTALRTGGTDQLASLRTFGLITADQLAAGRRWQRDWLAYAHGVAVCHGDAADHAIASVARPARTMASMRCWDVRDDIGCVGEMILTMMLIEGNSPSVIGSKLYLADDRRAASARAYRACILVIEQLAKRYSAMDAR